MTALSDLIAKLEAAEKGNQKLGDKVLLACGWKTAPNFDRDTPQPYWIRPDGQNVATNRPDPTTSLDAALTLIPDGYHLQLSQASASGRSDWSVTVSKQSPGFMRGYSGKLALALCIAALKAREAAR